MSIDDITKLFPGGAGGTTALARASAKVFKEIGFENIVKSFKTFDDAQFEQLKKTIKENAQKNLSIEDRVALSKYLDEAPFKRAIEASVKINNFGAALDEAMISGKKVDINALAKTHGLDNAPSNSVKEVFNEKLDVARKLAEAHEARVKSIANRVANNTGEAYDVVEQRVRDSIGRRLAADKEGKPSVAVEAPAAPAKPVPPTIPADDTMRADPADRIGGSGRGGDDAGSSAVDDLGPIHPSGYGRGGDFLATLGMESSGLAEKTFAKANVLAKKLKVDELVEEASGMIARGESLSNKAFRDRVDDWIKELKNEIQGKNPNAKPFSPGEKYIVERYFSSDFFKRNIEAAARVKLFDGEIDRALKAGETVNTGDLTVKFGLNKPGIEHIKDAYTATIKAADEFLASGEIRHGGTVRSPEKFAFRGILEFLGLKSGGMEKNKVVTPEVKDADAVDVVAHSMDPNYVPAAKVLPDQGGKVLDNVSAIRALSMGHWSNSWWAQNVENKIRAIFQETTIQSITRWIPTLGARERYLEPLIEGADQIINKSGIMNPARDMFNDIKDLSIRLKQSPTTGMTNGDAQKELMELFRNFARSNKESLTKLAEDMNVRISELETQRTLDDMEADKTSGISNLTRRKDVLDKPQKDAALKYLTHIRDMAIDLGKGGDANPADAITTLADAKGILTTLKANKALDQTFITKAETLINEAGTAEKAIADAQKAADAIDPAKLHAAEVAKLDKQAENSLDGLRDVIKDMCERNKIDMPELKKADDADTFLRTQKDALKDEHIESLRSEIFDLRKIEKAADRMRDAEPSKEFVDAHAAKLAEVAQKTDEAAKKVEEAKKALAAVHGTDNKVMLEFMKQFDPKVNATYQGVAEALRAGGLDIFSRIGADGADPDFISFGPRMRLAGPFGQYGITDEVLDKFAKDNKVSYTGANGIEDKLKIATDNGFVIKDANGDVVEFADAIAKPYMERRLALLRQLDFGLYVGSTNWHPIVKSDAATAHNVETEISKFVHDYHKKQVRRTPEGKPTWDVQEVEGYFVGLMGLAEQGFPADVVAAFKRAVVSEGQIRVQTYPPGSPGILKSMVETGRFKDKALSPLQIETAAAMLETVNRIPQSPLTFAERYIWTKYLDDWMKFKVSGYSNAGQEKDSIFRRTMGLLGIDQTYGTPGTPAKLDIQDFLQNQKLKIGHRWFGAYVVEGPKNTKTDMPTYTLSYKDHFWRGIKNEEANIYKDDLGVERIKIDGLKDGIENTWYNRQSGLMKMAILNPINTLTGGFKLPFYASDLTSHSRIPFLNTDRGTVRSFLMTGGVFEPWMRYHVYYPGAAIATGVFGASYLAEKGSEAAGVNNGEGWNLPTASVGQYVDNLTYVPRLLNSSTPYIMPITWGVTPWDGLNKGAQNARSQWGKFVMGLELDKGQAAPAAAADNSSNSGAPPAVGPDGKPVAPAAEPPKVMSVEEAARKVAIEGLGFSDFTKISTYEGLLQESRGKEGGFFWWDDAIPGNMQKADKVVTDLQAVVTEMENDVKLLDDSIKRFKTIPGQEQAARNYEILKAQLEETLKSVKGNGQSPIIELQEHQAKGKNAIALLDTNIADLAKKNDPAAIPVARALVQQQRDILTDMATRHVGLLHFREMYKGAIAAQMPMPAAALFSQAPEVPKPPTASEITAVRNLNEARTMSTDNVRKGGDISALIDIGIADLTQKVVLLDQGIKASTDAGDTAAAKGLAEIKRELLLELKKIEANTQDKAKQMQERIKELNENIVKKDRAIAGLSDEQLLSTAKGLLGQQADALKVMSGDHEKILDLQRKTLMAIQGGTTIAAISGTSASTTQSNESSDLYSARASSSDNVTKAQETITQFENTVRELESRRGQINQSISSFASLNQRDKEAQYKIMLQQLDDEVIRLKGNGQTQGVIEELRVRQAEIVKRDEAVRGFADEAMVPTANLYIRQQADYLGQMAARNQNAKDSLSRLDQALTTGSGTYAPSTSVTEPLPQDTSTTTPMSDADQQKASVGSVILGLFAGVGTGGSRGLDNQANRQTLAEALGIDRATIDQKYNEVKSKTTDPMAATFNLLIGLDMSKVDLNKLGTLNMADLFNARGPKQIIPELQKAMNTNPVIAQRVQWTMEAAARNGLDGTLLANQLWVESRFKPEATSPAGAIGIAQFMPDTIAARGLTEAQMRDPKRSIDEAAKLMKELTVKTGSQQLAAVAYNGGTGAIKFVQERTGGQPITINEWMGFMADRRSQLNGTAKDKASAWHNETFNYIRKIDSAYWDPKTLQDAMLAARSRPATSPSSTQTNVTPSTTVTTVTPPAANEPPLPQNPDLAKVVRDVRLLMGSTQETALNMGGNIGLGITPMQVAVNSQLTAMNRRIDEVQNLQVQLRKEGKGGDADFLNATVERTRVEKQQIETLKQQIDADAAIATQIALRVEGYKEGSQLGEAETDRKALAEVHNRMSGKAIEVKTVAANNLKMMKGNPVLSARLVFEDGTAGDFVKKAQQGVAQIDGGDGLLSRLTGAGSGTGGILGGLFNTVSNYGRAAHSWWTKDVKNSVAGDRTAETWYMGANVAMTGIAAAMAINLANKFGANINGGWRWLVIGAAVLYAMNGSGKDAVDFKAIGGEKRNAFGQSENGLDRIRTTPPAGASAIPAADKGSSGSGALPASTAAEVPIKDQKTGEIVKIARIDVAEDGKVKLTNEKGAVLSGEAANAIKFDGEMESKIAGVASGSCASLPAGQIGRGALKVEHSDGTSSEVSVFTACPAANDPSYKIRVGQ